ncbi:sensor histidine kinase [Muricauda oceani]|uniref:histidine kinase n=1 Tax=Flagellimonas oceani TaxID=2698672 RepID=A0A6G7J0K0_9FLAO|nr:sensor histidine kinase [Allomuricauda oceani]MBW8244222.1 sensor histidine kinase [Allomuricauda oceani]QII44128.1 HAMP domain-containing histidine kinase [Allomuricauda oceani]
MWKRIIKTSLALYIPLLIFSLVWGYLQKDSLIKNMGEIQQRNILNKSYHLIDQSIILVKITSFWSDVKFPESFSEENPLDSTFISNYIRIMQGLDVYHQLRFIDLHGDEVMRYERFSPDSMTPAPLQSKIDRGYFQKGLTLSKGQIYVTPIELNRENGVLETPHKPVIRGVTPIFDNRNVQVGLAVVNFDMDKIFGLMRTRITDDNFYLLDKDRNVITTNLSNGILPHQSHMSPMDSSIKKRLELKKLIFPRDTFFMENGSLWAYQNVRTGFEKDVGMNRYADMAEIVSDDSWAILQETPHQYLRERLQPIRRNLILFNALTLIVIAIIAMVYARTQRERKNFLEQLQHQKNALVKSQAQLKESNNLVKSANERLKVRNRQLEDFNYVVAHNLKAPVTSMSIIVNMLGKSEDKKTMRELLPKLETISNNISTLTEDVQTYVSILNNQDLKVENVNLLLLIKNVENDFVENLLDEAPHEFETIYKLDAWHSIKCSPFYMKSIVQNLISNAIKYRQSDAESHIVFESAWENDKKVLYVKDNGLGIDMERHKDSLFKLYKRFHRSYSGKGMGLFIVKSQLEAMNASIEVESKEGVGTTFKIKFH